MTTNIFGVIIAGRPLQAEFTQVSETEFLIEIPNADVINHIVVFLTGVQLFPENLGGSVYIRWLSPGCEDSWHYLGFISNGKPSAIYKVTQLHKTESTCNVSLFNSHSGTIDLTAGSAQIGIIVEDLNTIQSKVPAEGTSASNQATMASFTEKMLQNFFNHICSFAVNMPNPAQPMTTADYVPIKVVQDWFNTFQRRLQMNPSYWKTLT